MIRDTNQIKNSNIWQKAVKNNQNPTSLDRRTIIVLGDQKSGKTSFIKIIKGDYDLQSKPTRLIDFYTMKKQSVEFQFYEISSPKFQQMIQFYLKSDTIAFTSIVLCVDLTNKQNFVSRINQKIQSLRGRFKEIINRKNYSEIKGYNEQRSKFYHFIQKNQDVQIIKRMPFHFIIAGCKYDLFEKMQIQQRKWISRCLRYIAHVNQGDLFYSSTKNMQICAQLRNIFIEQLLNNRSPALSNQRDHTKPIFILAGQDKISQMNLPAFNNSGAFNQMKILQQQLQSIFPSKKHIEIKKQQNKLSKFNSIGLDSLINKHKKEIANILNDKKKKKTQKKLNSTNNFGSTNNFASTNNFNNTKSKISPPSILQNNQNLQQSHQIDELPKKILKKKQKQQYMDQDDEDYQD